MRKFEGSGRALLLIAAAPTALLLASALAAGTARAQQAAVPGPGSAGAGLEEIVVTAEKRSENIQSVPIAVTAFTAATLQDKAITDISGMSRLTPNVNLDTASPFGGSNEVLSASIRGIGQDDFAFNLDPGVGVYVDGIYLARTVGANVNLLDVDRVEILKGPQGTLFGRNTIGGAISVVTRTPGDQYTFEGEVTAGSYNRRDFNGTADIPLADNLLTSITFSSENRDGYQQRVPYPGASGYISDAPTAMHASDYASQDTQGGQGVDVIREKILWKAADNVTVTITGDWTHVDESSVPETVLQTVTSPKIQGAVFGPLYNECVSGDKTLTFFGAPPAIEANLVCGPRGPGLSGGNTGVTIGNPALGPGRLLYGNQFITGNIDTTYATGNNFDKMDSFGGAFTVDWALQDGLDLKSISGYRKLDWKVGLDLDGSPIDFLEPSFSEGQHQFSQEEQLTGTALGGDLNWVAGLYYFNEGGFIHDFVTFPAGLLQIDGPNYLDTSSYASYVHADYKVWDGLSLIAGARYSYDHKTFIGEQHDLNAFDYKLLDGLYRNIIGVPGGTYPVTPLAAELLGYADPSNPLQYMPPGTSTENFYEFTPTAGLQYQFTDDLMAYYTYSKGFKSGGWTTRLSNPQPARLGDPEFGPEKAETHEIGIKSEWLDHRLLLNWAGFYTEYDGIQLNFQEGVSPTYKNAGDATILGSELEGRGVLGGGFFLNFTGAYMDAYYTFIAPGLNSGQSCIQPYEPCITVGTKLPKTPKFKASISPEYDMDLSNEATLRFQVDYTHTSSMFNDSLNTSLLRRPDTGIVDASITYVSPDDRYEIVAGGTNITDDRYLTTGQEQTAGGVIFGTYDAPAEWYLTLRVKFQGEKAPAPMEPAPAPPPVAAPAAPPAPTPEAQRNFEVFFDFDKSDITSAAAQVIQAAADSVKAGNLTRITVTGHTDTVGTVAYNQKLSERRAAAVKQTLTADGVDGGEITTIGVGKTGLLVPTADGVREPQNRRAEIVLQ